MPRHEMSKALKEQNENRQEQINAQRSDSKPQPMRSHLVCSNELNVQQSMRDESCKEDKSIIKKEDTCVEAQQQLSEEEGVVCDDNMFYTEQRLVAVQEEIHEQEAAQNRIIELVDNHVCMELDTLSRIADQLSRANQASSTVTHADIEHDLICHERVESAEEPMQVAEPQPACIVEAAVDSSSHDSGIAVGQPSPPIRINSPSNLNNTNEISDEQFNQLYGPQIIYYNEQSVDNRRYRIQVGRHGDNVRVYMPVGVCVNTKAVLCRVLGTYCQSADQLANFNTSEIRDLLWPLSLNRHEENLQTIRQLIAENIVPERLPIVRFSEETGMPLEPLPMEIQMYKRPSYSFSSVQAVYDEEQDVKVPELDQQVAQCSGCDMQPTHQAEQMLEEQASQCCEIAPQGSEHAQLVHWRYMRYLRKQKRFNELLREGERRLVALQRENEQQAVLITEAMRKQEEATAQVQAVAQASQVAAALANVRVNPNVRITLPTSGRANTTGRGKPQSTVGRPKAQKHTRAIKRATNKKRARVFPQACALEFARMQQNQVLPSDDEELSEHSRLESLGLVDYSGMIEANQDADNQQVWVAREQPQQPSPPPAIPPQQPEPQPSTSRGGRGRVARTPRAPRAPRAPKTPRAQASGKKKRASTGKGIQQAHCPYCYQLFSATFNAKLHYNGRYKGSGKHISCKKRLEIGDKDWNPIVCSLGCYICKYHDIPK